MTNLCKKLILLPVFSSLLIMGACTTVAVSNPPRTATEELLISRAADRAAAQLALGLPKDSKVFIDSSNFEGTDSKYAIGAIHGTIMAQGLNLVDAKKDADIVIEIRSGALSIDNSGVLIGTPSFGIPIPFAATSFTIPEIAFYKSADQKGVAKFAATAYDAKTGSLIKAGDPQYGFTHNKDYTVLFIISWQHNESLPKAAGGAETDDDVTSP